MPAVTPAPRVDRILTGHERREHDRCWRPAGTEDWLLVHTLSGRAHVTIADEQVPSGPGATVLYRPGAAQDFAGDAAAGPWELCWAHFHPPPNWLDLLRWPELGPDVLFMPAPGAPLLARIEALLLEMDRLSGSGLPLADRLALNALEAALLWWELQNAAHAPLDSRVLEAIDYLSRALSRQVPIGELASVVHLSASRLSHLFREQTGVTPHRFAELQRLERAKQLLELTSLPINTVANEVGFGSQFYFATRFRRLTGSTPSAFRAARRDEAAGRPPGYE